MLLFSFSVLVTDVNEIENENNRTKTLIVEAPFIELVIVEFSL